MCWRGVDYWEGGGGLVEGEGGHVEGRFYGGVFLGGEAGSDTVFWSVVIRQN